MAGLYIDGQKKLVILLYGMAYFDTEAILCYKMHAPFLIDNSVKMALENFSYSETNMVPDFDD